MTGHKVQGSVKVCSRLAFPNSLQMLEFKALRDSGKISQNFHEIFLEFPGRLANGYFVNRHFEFQCAREMHIFRELAGRLFLTEGSSLFPPFLSLKGSLLGTFHGFSKYPFAKYVFELLIFLGNPRRKPGNSHSAFSSLLNIPSNYLQRIQQLISHSDRNVYQTNSPEVEVGNGKDYQCPAKSF